MGVAGAGKAVFERIAWKIRPSESVGLDRLDIVEGRYLVSSSGSRQRTYAMLRVSTQPAQEDPRLDYAGTMRMAVQQQRLKGLFEGLLRAKVPFLYMTMMTQSDGPDRKELFEFDLVVGTWVDGKWKKGEELLQTLEQRAEVLLATLTVALPAASVSRLEMNELRGFAKGFYLPCEPPLRQTGDASTLSSLCDFEERSPQVFTADHSPGFYVPNSSESGRSGILLGSVRSGGGTFHEFRLQLEDLRRHVAILGMTGSGKSTTAGTIVRQVAEAGMPVLVLDWHNEYSSVVAAAGGTTVSPGRDSFSLNPLEVGSSGDPVEHMAMVSDIFSDIYRFTHPQAFMFRSALQKRLADGAQGDVPTISSLVKTIESFPLRSAYDNETKVALLRRLVPLTQGQAGRALEGPGEHPIEDLLGSTVCVELGHLRDIQTRSVFAEIMLKVLYEHRAREKHPLEHMTVVEEARNIAPARRVEDPPAVGERMISELRKFGEAMMFVAQFPSQVASEVVKNSGTRIVHRVAWPEDVAVIGDSMHLTVAQREHITKLAVGEAVVSLARVQNPILLQVRADSPPSGPSRDFSFPGEP